MSSTHELIPHLFRTEHRKMVSVLCKQFGMTELQQAEDIVSDTFLLAAESWGLKGIPDNPTAWLYVVAKNKAKDGFRRSALFQEKISPEIQERTTDIPEEADFSEHNLLDSQLQMMFALCHPEIPAEAQIGLALRILCGFGIEEIARAFLSTKPTINKRLFRAKEKLRHLDEQLAFPSPSELPRRLHAVLRTLYLLFNEGYHGSGPEQALRKDLCYEAMQLTALLTQNPLTETPAVHALLALMCFHASRFEARTDAQGEWILYEKQDCSRWNQALIQQGERHLNAASRGDQVSTYHFEAAIAYWHCQQEDGPEKWEQILSYYHQLLMIEYSPMAALNRTYALFRVKGAAEAIREAKKLGLADHPFYHALLGHLFRNLDLHQSLTHYQTAHSLSRSPANQKSLQHLIAEVQGELG
jgi:RNA polymerase sigma-70 factor (ECF subfamily)